MTASPLRSPPSCSRFRTLSREREASSHLHGHSGRNGWNRLGEPPGHAALLDHVFQHLFVLQCVHRAPEALVLEGQELFGIDQPPEGFFDQLLALAHIVEDLRAKYKEATVDPEV